MGLCAGSGLFAARANRNHSRFLGNLAGRLCSGRPPSRREDDRREGTLRRNPDRRRTDGDVRHPSGAGRAVSAGHPLHGRLGRPRGALRPGAPDRDRRLLRHGAGLLLPAGQGPQHLHQRQGRAHLARQAQQGGPGQGSGAGEQARRQHGGRGQRRDPEIPPRRRRAGEARRGRLDRLLHGRPPRHAGRGGISRRLQGVGEPARHHAHLGPAGLASPRRRRSCAASSIAASPSSITTRRCRWSRSSARCSSRAR